jgi:hypothetical protein
LIRGKAKGGNLGELDRGGAMPQILVVTDVPEASESEVVYRERIALTDLESDHFSAQLVERVGWAVHDADELEHRDPRVINQPQVINRQAEAFPS